MLCVIRTMFAALACVSFLAGCGGSQPTKSSSATSSSAHGHDHEKGPHDGQLLELGNEEYHAEVVIDEAADKITIYVLDSGAKDPVATTAKEVVINAVADGKPVRFALLAEPQTGDAAGSSSRFSLASHELHELLESKETKARLAIEINGKSYSALLAAHDHHGH